MAIDPTDLNAGAPARFGGVSDATWVLAILGYFAAHIAYRCVLGGALGLDEAEMMLDAQSFRLGYGPQLPLYAWMQALVFQLTGSTLFGLALLKNALLCAMVLTVYGLLRTAFGVREAIFATAALMLLPQISWESQRALTHSVLASFSAVACVATVWWLARAPSLPGYLILGCALAAGGLSKYNFALVPVAVFLAVLSLPDLRAKFFGRQLLAALLLAALLLAAPYAWIVKTPELAFASAQKFNIAQDATSALAPLRSLAALASATFNFLVLPGLVAGLLLLFCGKRGAAPRPPALLERLLLRMIAIALVLVAVAAVATGVTEIRDRWLQPVLILAAPVLVLWLLPRLTQRGERVLCGVYLGIGVLIFVGLPVHFFRPGADVAARFDLVAPDLLQSIPADTAIFAPQYVAGNLFRQAPDRSLRKLIGVLQVPEAGAVLVWEGRDLPMGAGLLASGFHEAEALSLADHRVFEAPYRFSREGESFTLSSARIVRN